MSRGRWVVAATTWGWLLACTGGEEAVPEPELVEAEDVEPEPPPPPPEPKGPELTVRLLLSTSPGALADQAADNDETTYWAPVGDARGEGLHLELLEPYDADAVRLLGCSGVEPFEVELYAGGQQVGVTTVDGDVSLSLPAGEPLQRLYVRSLSPTACLAEIAPVVGGLPARLVVPRRVEARIQASSIKEPVALHHPAYLFDGRPDWAWVEGAKGHGDGQSLSLTFRQDQLISGLEVWNGRQRDQASFDAVGRVRKAEIEASGRRMMLDLADTSGSQRHDFDPPLTTRHLSFTIAAVVPGAAKKEVAISELVFFDRTGPFTIRPMKALTFDEKVKAKVVGTVLEPLVDRFHSSPCDRQADLKLRSDHSFVHMATHDSEEGSWVEVFEGRWLPGKDGKITVDGRRYLVADGRDDDAERPEPAPLEGELTVRPLAEVEEAELAKLAKAWSKAGHGAALDCLLTDGKVDADKVASLVAGEAVLLEGEPLRELLVP